MCVQNVLEIGGFRWSIGWVLYFVVNVCIFLLCISFFRFLLRLGENQVNYKFCCYQYIVIISRYKLYLNLDYIIIYYISCVVKGWVVLFRYIFRFRKIIQLDVGMLELSSNKQLSEILR